MSKVIRSVEPEKPWMCQTCTFENHPMISHCEVCSSQRNGQLPKLPEPPVAAKQSSKDGKIICSKCGKYNLLALDACQQCKSPLFEDHQSNKIFKDLVECKNCKLPNSKDNLICVNCERSLNEKILQKQPSKQVQINKCPICSCELAQIVFQRHLKECEQSRKLMIQLEKQREYERTDECPYCLVRFDRKLSEKHIIDCSKNNKYFKENKIFGRMTPLQKSTIEFMHVNSQKQHFSAKPQLQQRFKKLKLKKEDLEALLHYIQNYAPIIVHIHITKHMEFFIKDTHYRNQFETGKSSGSLSRPSRISWQSRMFCKKYDSAKDFERVKYGTINFTNDPKGVNSCRGYGNSYFLLKSDVRERCTLTDQDSSSANSLIGTFRFCYHVLNRLTDAELKAAVQAAQALEVSSAVVGTYKEIQIHGPLQFDKDIERLYVNKIEIQDPKFMKMVQEFSRRFKVDYQIFN